MGAHILNVIAVGVIPLVLAGIGGHLATLALPNTRHRLYMIVFVWVLAVGGVVAFGLVEHNASKSEEANDKAHHAEVKNLSDKLDSVGNQNNKLLTGLVGPTKLSEPERRKAVQDSLRSEYILHHSPIDPMIVAGKAYPPADWMNERLKQLNETWSIVVDTGTLPVAKTPRSYMRFSPHPYAPPHDGPLVPGSEWAAGDLFGFNILYQLDGSHPVDIIANSARVYVATDQTLQTQQAIATKFQKHFSEALRKAKKPGLTQTPDQANFFTAVADPEISELTYGTAQNGESVPVLTEQQLQRFKDGSNYVFVLAEIAYVDQGVKHFARMCEYLQKPASTLKTPWVSCGVFGNSD